MVKILQDEFSISTDDEGRATVVAHLSKKPKGSYRLGSAVDPEATFRVHGDATLSAPWPPLRLPPNAAPAAPRRLPLPAATHRTLT